MIDVLAKEFDSYRGLGEKVLELVDNSALNRRLSAEANSLAVVAHHIGGNLKSRFTCFFTEDGEKPWRERDGEFAERDRS